MALQIKMYLKEPGGSVRILAIFDILLHNEDTSYGDMGVRKRFMLHAIYTALSIFEKAYLCQPFPGRPRYIIWSY